MAGPRTFDLLRVSFVTVLVLQLATVLTLATVRNVANDCRQEDPENFKIVWNYLLQEYSKSKAYLTSDELKSIVRRHCSKTQNRLHSVGAAAPECHIPFNLKGNITETDISSALFRNLTYWIDNSSCCSNFVETAENRDETTPSPVSHDKKAKPSHAEVWGYGILFVTLISLSSLVGVSVLPLMGKDFYKHLLTVMVGLAVGSLTGSAIFHLLPQAFGLDEMREDNEYLTTSLVVWGGIWLFFMIERILKSIMDYKDRKEKKWKHEKIACVLPPTSETSTLSMLVDSKMMNPEADDSRSSTSVAMCSPQPTTGTIYECQEQAIKASFGHQERPRPSNGHDHVVKFEQGKDSVIATVAWMIIFGDGLHNFIDGLSIGAAFQNGILTGVSISVAVLCEELPHELGDFAVLLNAGMSMKQALLYNFLSACTCYLGLGFGILLGEIEASSYIFALAGGMFLYISLVDMVPEMNEVAEETSKISVWNGVKVLMLQNLGLFAGITALYVLAKYQDNIQF